MTKIPEGMSVLIPPYKFNIMHNSLCIISYFALIICRIVLHDLSVLAISRTMQSNSRLMEFIIHLWKQSGRTLTLRCAIDFV